MGGAYISGQKSNIVHTLFWKYWVCGLLPRDCLGSHYWSLYQQNNNFLILQIRYIYTYIWISHIKNHDIKLLQKFYSYLLLIVYPYSKVEFREMVFCRVRHMANWQSAKPFKKLFSDSFWLLFYRMLNLLKTGLAQVAIRIQI